MFVDSFSVGLDEIPPKELTIERILQVLDQKGRFSTFEASAHPKIAGMMTHIMHSDLVESYTPDAYKSKPEPGGARAPDRDTYPWTYVRLTPAGRERLKQAA